MTFPFGTSSRAHLLMPKDALQRYPKSELTIGKHEFRKDEFNEYSRSHTYSGREKTMGA
jgi:hypothetical protein